QLADQIPVVARRLRLVALELIEQCLDSVDSGQDQRDRLTRYRAAATKASHQRFGRMGERLEPRQAEEAARPFDGVDEAEDVVEDLGVVRLLLEAHQLHIDDVQAFARLGEEVPQQLVHGPGYFQRNTQPADSARMDANSAAI